MRCDEGLLRPVCRRWWTVLPEKRQREWWGNTGEASPLKVCVAVRVPIIVAACSTAFTYEWLTFLCSQLILTPPLFCLAYPIHVIQASRDWAGLAWEALAENRGRWSLQPGPPTSDCREQQLQPPTWESPAWRVLIPTFKPCRRAFEVFGFK